MSETACVVWRIASKVREWRAREGMPCGCFCYGAYRGGEIYPGVTVDPAVVHGKPALTGTRIPVTLVLGQLAAGETVESICDAYDLTAQ